MNHLYHVDAFTEVPFKGNPAAVCIIEDDHSDQWMLQVSADMNLSETAFIRKQTDGYGLKWFTPKKEVSLCGHATLATAHILWEEGLINPTERIELHTLSGKLTANRNGKVILLDFPARKVSPIENSNSISLAIGDVPTFTNIFITERGTIYLLEYDDEKIVRDLHPDFNELLKTDARSVIVTSRSSSTEYDFVSRYFAPAVGINEDPVTGSSHCCLAPYWAAKLGKVILTGYQASPRGGFVQCKYIGDRVQIGGKAVTISKGELIV
jgi:PhzF family phenazine biosynthesis protein